MLILVARLQHRTPQFSTADNPSAREPSASTRFMTFSYLPLVNFLMMLFPSALSFDWGMDAIPRVTSVRDPRVLFTLCFYALIGAVIWTGVCHVLERKGWKQFGVKETIKTGEFYGPHA